MAYLASSIKKSRGLLILAAIGLLLLGMLIGALMGRSDDKTATQNTNATQTLQAADDVVMAVEAITPKATTTSQSISANGSIVGKEIANVGARVNGVAIEQVLVEVGDVVRAGQVLALLDNQTANQDVVAATAEVEQAQVNLNKAKTDLARVEPLIKIDAISREQYDGYQVAVQQAQSQLTAAKARLSNVRTYQGNTQVVAPVSGVISERNADVGMLTGGVPLFTIIKNGVLEWQAGVNAHDAGLIAAGMGVEIDTPNGVALGVVTRIAPVANASRELLVHATITQGELSGGMYQSGRILLGRQQVLILPRQAIGSSDGYDYVWQLIKEGDGRADIYQVRRTPVVLGAGVDDGVAVDLPPDIWVVAQGGGFLNEGDKVTVSNANSVGDSVLVPSNQSLISQTTQDVR